MNRTALGPAIALAFSLSLAGCGGTESDKAQQGAQGGGGQASSVVRVNGVSISEQDLAREISLLKQQMQGRASSQQLDAMEQTMRQQAAVNLVNRTLLTQAADKQGLSVTAEEVDAKYQEIRSNFASEEAFTQQLQRSSMNDEQFRGEIEKGLRLEALVEVKTAHLGVPTDEEVRAFYDSNIERFTSQERIRASHVLITTNENDTELVKQQKKERIEAVHKRILSGEDIAAIAAVESDCPSKNNGGDLGFFSRGQMVKAFEDAAFALAVGAVSPVVETQFGYHVIKVTEREPAGVMPFEDIKGNIYDYLLELRKQEEMNRYMTELRGAATIEYVDSTLSVGM